LTQLEKRSKLAFKETHMNAKKPRITLHQFRVWMAQEFLGCLLGSFSLFEVFEAFGLVRLPDGSYYLPKISKPKPRGQKGERA
jgi:hypothetical protein